MSRCVNRCVFANETDLKTDVNLLLPEPPVFVTKPEATKLVSGGSTLRLECKAMGSPVIAFKWSKNQTDVVADAHKYRMSATDLVACLEVVACTVEDSGDYVCVASSEAGADRCSSTVTVKGWFRFLACSYNLPYSVEMNPL